MTSGRDHDELPDDVLAGLDLGGDDGAAPDLSSLESIKQRIQQDLENRQGGYREASRVGRVWPVAVALVAGVGFALAMSPVQLAPLALLSVVVTGLAAVLAVGAVSLSPSRPGVGERVAIAGLAVGGLALVLQAVSGLGHSATPLSAIAGSVKCSSVMFMGAAVPLVVLGLWIRRSGLPLRALHASGLAVAAFALAGVGVFRHCAPVETWHTMFAHVLAPALGVTLAALALYRLMQRRFS